MDCQRLLLSIVFPCPGKKAYSHWGSILVFPPKQAYFIKESYVIKSSPKLPIIVDLPETTRTATAGKKDGLVLASNGLGPGIGFKQDNGDDQIALKRTHRQKHWDQTNKP